MAKGPACLSAAPTAASPFCRPEEDPFLLLDSSLRAVQGIAIKTAFLNKHHLALLF
jgi:hypothetical protein